MRRAPWLALVTAALALIACPVRAADPPDKANPPKPVPTAGEKSNPLPILRPSKPAELSADEIRKEMDTLFRWDQATPYYYYLLSLPKPLKLKDAYVGRFDDMVGKDYLVHPYNANPIEPTYRGPAISLRVPTELQGLSEKNGMCVKLDGFGDPVPIPAAEYFCAHFHNGFVTRLVIGEYVRAWSKAGAKIDIDALNFASTVQKQPIPPAFAQLASYQTKMGDKTVEAFDAGLERLMAENDLASTGILWGWKAAGELDAMREKPGDQRYFQAAWRLVRSRFSPRQMGEIAAFTMHFTLGFARVATVRATTPTEANPVRDVSVILNRLAGEKDVVAAKSLLASFHDTFLAEFYAITINPNFKPEEKEQLLSAYFDFIRGWESGSLQAGDEMFRRAFQLGYTYGFRDGFKDGYTRGYAAGYRDGYATGYKEAWSQANKVIDQLKGELTAKEEALKLKDEEIKRLTAERGGSGILKFIQDVAETASKVIPVIVSIAGLLAGAGAGGVGGV
ncbi:MAG: hypothetical protein K2X82_17305 [Gemmataceae bacterium]|nr:hypothetical protein [Gemmataceae bacterium]